MKKALIIIFIVAIAFGIFYYLRYFFERDKVDIWDLVPGNTLAVYETEQPIKIWNELLELPIWKNLSSVPEINRVNDQLEFLDSISGSSGNLERLFRDRRLLVSLHKISNTEFGLTFYFPINTSDKKNILNGIIKYYKGKPDVKNEIRYYEDFAINELSDVTNDRIFTFIEFKDHFIGSFTPFLIDDVVRNISGNFQSGFKSISSGIFNTQPIEMDEGNLYVNITRIPDLIRNFSHENRSQPDDLEHLEWFTGATYYDISFEDNRIFFNGSSRIPSNSEAFFLSTFYNQSPQNLEAIYFLPNRTSSYVTYTYDNFAEWRKSVDIYWESHFPELLNEKTALLQDYGIYENEFYGWIGTEIGLATLRSIDPEHPDRIVMIRTEDYSESVNVLDNLIQEVNNRDNDTLLYEDYSGKRIKMIGIPELPAKLLGDEFSGFENSYYTDLGSFIVIGNSFEVVKHMLGEIEDENTWGKSLKFMQYFDNVQKRANVSYFINFGNAWNAFVGSLNEEWGSFFKNFDRQFKHFELLSFQFSNINNTFYTSAAVQHRQETSVMATPSEFFKEQLVITDYPIITKPYIFRSHLDRSLEVMAQDAGNNLYFISSSGEVLWKKAMGTPIRSDIFQVDFFRNGKLQYLFATDSSLHIYDRNGIPVGGFPVKLNHPIQLDHFNLIDYDNSRNYRYLLCDASGNIYLTDKNGKELSGWMPKETGGKCIEAPLHARIGGRDCMIAIRNDGVVHMFNRRSEAYEGFPVDLNSGLSNSFFIQRGADFQKSMIHLVNENGEIFRINLNGEIVEKSQLYRPEKESRFDIIPDAMNNTFVICRQDFNNIAVLDQKGNTIFERELLFTEDLDVQFYHFGAGNEVYVFTDAQQGFTYLLDGNGNLINMQPVESGFKVGLLYSEASNKYNLYTCFRNQFSVISFYKK